jgi:hypothetical protein
LPHNTEINKAHFLQGFIVRIISKKLRASARGKDCTLRIPSVCSFNPEQTILAHLPCGHKGAGMKGPDIIAVFACAHCHSFIDGPRRHELTGMDYLRALAETQMQWVESGLITVKGMQ